MLWWISTLHSDKVWDESAMEGRINTRRVGQVWTNCKTPDISCRYSLWTLMWLREREGTSGTWACYGCLADRSVLSTLLALTVEVTGAWSHPSGNKLLPVLASCRTFRKLSWPSPSCLCDHKSEGNTLAASEHETEGRRGDMAFLNLPKPRDCMLARAGTLQR